MGITKIKLCVLGSCLSWEKEATPVTHQLGERHIQTYGSVDKIHVPRDDGTFMSEDVSVSTAQRGNLYSERIDNRTFTALTYMEQCLLFLLQVKINHMKKFFANMHLSLTTAWMRTRRSNRRRQGEAGEVTCDEPSLGYNYGNIGFYLRKSPSTNVP
jgi:hypothetical protein